MSVLAVIPTRYERHRIRRLLLSLTDCDVLVLDNGHEPPLRWPMVEDARGMGIYAMWNRGWRTARERGYEVVAILNDDIRILAGTVSRLAAAVLSGPKVGIAYPDWPRPLTDGLPSTMRLQPTAGTVSVGAMTGFAFAMRTDLPVKPFDEGFGWWYGDDAFERSVRRAGYTVCRVEGLPCEHESDSEANGWARRPELEAIAEADRRRWEAIA